MKAGHGFRRKEPGTRFLGGALVLGVILSGIFGCAAVGPDYIPPEDRAPGAWHAPLQDGLTADPLDPRTIAEWWTGFGDPVLSALIMRAAADNLDVAGARARVREARARRGLSQSGLFPVLDATASATKSRSSENGGSGRESDFFAAGFDAGWELDVFGGVRRSIEAADAELAASTQDLYDVLVSLTAETALNYVEVRTFQTRIRVAEANIRTQEETYSLTRSRFEAGLSDELPVQQALSNLENSRSQVPVLRSGLEAAKNRLAVLSGMVPGAVHEMLSAAQPVPVSPGAVAVGVPAETLRRRPDIRGAEWRLAAQTAKIGEAVADLYPRFRLSGAIGLESISTGDLIDAGSRSWRIGPGISWNIFDAGAVRRNIEVRSALQEQALVQYEAAVLAALAEVENALTDYVQEQLRRSALIAAVEAAERATELARDQYAAGLVDFSNVLISERALLTLQDNLALSDGTVTADLVRLYKALGGGWERAIERAETGSPILGETP